MKFPKFSPESFFKRTIEAKQIINKGGRGALEAHFELNNIGSEANEHLYDEAKLESKNIEEDIAKEKAPKNLENLENLENMEKLVNETIELIRHHPQFNYVVSANGNLFGDKRNGSTNGQHQYYYSEDHNRMIEDRKEKFPTLEQELRGDERDYDDPKTKNAERIRFKPYWTNSLKEYRGEKQVTFSVHFPFVAYVGESNPFTTEKRNGHDLSFTLSFLIKDGFSSDSGLMDFMKKPDSNEAKEFFMKLFIECNKKWLPEYWDFFLKQKIKQGK